MSDTPAVVVPGKNPFWVQYAWLLALSICLFLAMEWLATIRPSIDGWHGWLVINGYVALTLALLLLILLPLARRKKKSRTMGWLCLVLNTVNCFNFFAIVWLSFKEGHSHRIVVAFTPILALALIAIRVDFFRKRKAFQNV